MEESLELFRRQYFEMLPLEQMTFPSDDVLKQAHFQVGLYQRLSNPGPSSNRLSDRYKLRILRAILFRLESLMSEPDEDVCF